MIGYYQSWNVRNRACNKAAPRDLDTTDYTHLYYSFASIDPATYHITPAHADDPAMMREFTGLAKDGLQTWIAVGGFDFSDEGTPTHTTWSDVCATRARRAAFINSVKAYMDEYGFQGVDLDWEYPGDARRGGNGLDDTRNLVLLVKEMREAYGNSYGISLTLAPDYWYLRWFDPKAMEPYVDYFGFMAYDLHGSWDSDVLTLGKKVRGQADIREIADNTVPLWFDGLNPAKINFGLAMYGRGYTLADPTCNQLLCPFAGASDPAPCTNSPGVMSLLEIQQLIKRKGITPQYLPDSMMKQITWDDQWIGYDDEETFAAKKAWADSRCFGGTMVWSIDFQVAGSGNSDEEKYGEVVYVGSEIFQTATAQCPAPCILVFPTSDLAEPKVITIPPYTARLEVGTTTTTIVVGPTPRTTTITSIDYFNHYITSAQQPGDAFTLQPRFQPPPTTVAVTGQDGQTTMRVILPPPLGGGVATDLSSNQTGGGGGGGGSGSTVTRTTKGTLPPATAWPWIPPPTRTPEPDLSDDEVVVPPFPPYDGGDGGTNPNPTSTTTTGSDPSNPNPTTGTTTRRFPTDSTASIVPVTDTSNPVPPGGTRVRCNFWFFFICISWGELNLHIDWWDIVLPPGQIGPGPLPPDLLKLPPGWGIRCPGTLPCGLPPWPKITVGPGGAFPSAPPAEPNPCETVTATLTIETTSYGTTTTGGTVTTTATRILSSEFPMLGCALTDTSTTTKVTACEARPTPASARRRRADEATGPPIIERDDCDNEDTRHDVYCTLNNPEDESTQVWINQLNMDEHDQTYQFKEFMPVGIRNPSTYMAFVYFTQVRIGYLEQRLNGQHNAVCTLPGCLCFLLPTSSANVSSSAFATKCPQRA
jgi:chitinase